ncbi:MAG TPA: FkbM family methyltransferase, partial [Chitinophagaceae bacterium]|nr:FkbM family methyltransferase [Chitinophagaceae bacterium]
SEGNTEKYNVNITTIDDIVNAFQLHPDLIKIDAEGAELDVLKGGIKTLNEKKPILILGLHPKFIKQKGDSIEAIWEILMAAHYKIEMEGREVTKETFCNSELLFDIHCC